jgi:hypothetical protein
MGMAMATSTAIIIPIVPVVVWVVAMGRGGCQVWIWGLMLLLTGLEMVVDLHLIYCVLGNACDGEYGVWCCCFRLDLLSHDARLRLKTENWNSDEDIYDDMMNCVE